MLVVKKALEWYVNRYSNGWNQNCDVCWSTHIAVAHFLYGIAPIEIGVLVAIVTVCMKAVQPTDWDLEQRAK